MVPWMQAEASQAPGGRTIYLSTNQPCPTSGCPHDSNQQKCPGSCAPSLSCNDKDPPVSSSRVTEPRQHI